MKMFFLAFPSTGTRAAVSSFAFPTPVSKFDLASMKVGIHFLNNDAGFLFFFWRITLYIKQSLLFSAYLGIMQSLYNSYEFLN
jgi:hypothetical protein